MRSEVTGVEVLPSLWGAWCGGRRKYRVRGVVYAMVRGSRAAFAFALVCLAVKFLACAWNR
ncbi:hypothetical protein SAMN06272765_4343 [Streptomyces sp. Ag109_G2-15]|nr:hypothetical protein SAMN06272765_4343 [Streptomyces sp. Ag109_G2-15]